MTFELKTWIGDMVMHDGVAKIITSLCMDTNTMKPFNIDDISYELFDGDEYVYVQPKDCDTHSATNIDDIISYIVGDNSDRTNNLIRSIESGEIRGKNDSR